MLYEKILRKKPTQILLLLRDSTKTWNASQLARETNTSYVHVTKTLAEYERAGLVYSNREGRIKILKLTEQGSMVAGLLEEIVKTLRTEPQPNQTQQTTKTT